MYYLFPRTMEVNGRKCLFAEIQRWKKLGRSYCSKLYLYEYSLQVPSDVEFTANSILREDKDIKLTSVYHTVLGKRLLVDGVHHAIGLQLKVNRNEQVPEVRLMECYGTKVAEMFKADFVHL